jgi:hypothetical protein
MNAEPSDIGTSVPSERQTIAGLPLRLLPVFFLGIPLAVGLNQGWLQAGLARYLPRDESVLLWCGNWLLFWFACELATRIAAVVLRPWRVRPLVLIVFGAVLAALLSPLYFSVYSLMFVDSIPPGVRASEAELMRHMLEPAGMIRPLASGSGGILLWVLANYFFQSYLGWPRFRALGLEAAGPQAESAPTLATPSAALLPTAPTGGPSPVPPLFARLSRIAAPTEKTLLAIEAQEHYVKVHTDHGAELVYYRFGDAMRDLNGWNGLQVHRSWWVARSAVQRVEANERRLRILVRGELRVPVGSSFLAMVRQAGFPTVSDIRATPPFE